MKRKRKSFREICDEAEKPTEITPETKLPYVFDLHWDAKTVADLWQYGLTENADVLRYLAEAGFDVKTLEATQPKQEGET